MTDEGTDFRLCLLYAGGFRRLRAATYFAHGGKVGKTPPGTRPMDYGSASLRLGPEDRFPRTPLRGTRTCWILQHFRRAKFEWRSKFPPGHWALVFPKLQLVRGPGFPKITVGAVLQLRLALPNRRRLVLGCRARPPGRAAYICGPASVRSLREEHDRLLIRRRGGPCGRPRAGLGPAPTKRREGFYISRRGGS